MDGDGKTIDRRAGRGKGVIFFRVCDMSRGFDELFESAFGTASDQ